MFRCNPLTYSLVFLFSIIHSIYAQCGIPPLQLTWSNITVTEDGLGVARGVEVGIGTPNQVFAFRPSTTLNNTRINNVLSCGSAANDTCVGGLGGAFTPSKSATYSVSIKAQWNGSQIDAQSATGAYVYFNDEVDFQSNGRVIGFPLVMDSETGGGIKPNNLRDDNIANQAEQVLKVVSLLERIRLFSAPQSEEVWLRQKLLDYGQGVEVLLLSMVSLSLVDTINQELQVRSQTTR